MIPILEHLTHKKRQIWTVGGWTVQTYPTYSQIISYILIVSIPRLTCFAIWIIWLHVETKAVFKCVLPWPSRRWQQTLAAEPWRPWQTTKDVDSILRELRHCWRKKLLPGYIYILYCYCFLSCLVCVCVCQIVFIVVVIAIIDSSFVCHHQFVYHCILYIYIYKYV